MASQSKRDSVSKKKSWMAPEEQYPRVISALHVNTYICAPTRTHAHNFNTNNKNDPRRRVAPLKQGVLIDFPILRVRQEGERSPENEGHSSQ